MYFRGWIRVNIIHSREEYGAARLLIILVVKLPCAPTWPIPSLRALAPHAGLILNPPVLSIKPLGSYSFLNCCNLGRLLR